MTTFAFIVVLYTGGGVTAEFRHKAQCEAALADLRKQIGRSFGLYGGCYEKSN